MINSKAIEPDKLESIIGGAHTGDEKVQYMRMECPYCHDIFKANVMKTSVKCPTCHKPITIKG